MDMKHVKIVVVNSDGSELVMRHSDLGNRAIDALACAAQALEKMEQNTKTATSSIEEFNTVLNQFEGFED